MSKVCKGLIMSVFMLLPFMNNLVVAATSEIVFHFYGAYDCPPCMAFKRDGLPIVRTAASKMGFDVAVNLIDKTENVPVRGVYGVSDPLLRKAVLKLNQIYPPIFFITLNDEIHSVFGPDWRAALKTATSISSN